jgi:hypothetical protein
MLRQGTVVSGCSETGYARSVKPFWDRVYLKGSIAQEVA